MKRNFLILFLIILLIVGFIALYFLSKYTFNSTKINYRCVTDSDCEPRNGDCEACPSDYCANKKSQIKICPFGKGNYQVRKCITFKVKSCICVNNFCYPKEESLKY